MSKNMKKKMLQKVYDDLFKNKKDPMAANFFLLVLQLENYYKRKGVGVSISNLTASGKQIGSFMDRNKIVLQGLFLECFSNPDYYQFTGKFQSKKLDLIFDRLNYG